MIDISHWSSRKGGTVGGGPLRDRFQSLTERRRALIRIQDVFKPVWIRIKMPCLYSQIKKNPESVPERTLALDARPRTHFRGTPPVRYPRFDYSDRSAKSLLADCI